MSGALGWVARGGIATVVITSGDKVWTGEHLDAGELSRAIRDMRNGEWEPSEVDGWALAEGPFDPDGYLGWHWTAVGREPREPTTSTAYRYSITRDGIADLALNVHLDERLLDALRVPSIGTEIQTEIEDRVNQHIAQHGVNDVTGEWYGDWSAAAIVSDVLDAHKDELAAAE